MDATPPPFFKRGPSALFRLVAFGMLSIVLMVLDARLRYLEPIREIVSVAIYPLQQVAAAPIALAVRIADFFVTSSSLRTENATLRTDNLRLAAASQQLSMLKAENAELRALLEARPRFEQQAVLAEVLYGPRDPFSRKVLVDRGSHGGLGAGLAVVDDIGVVGQVTRVYPFVSEVTLITDQKQAVPVMNVRTGQRAVVFGSGREGTLDLRFMPVNADIRTGDTLVTSGIDGTYPPGLPVAEVAHVERNAALAFARIVCHPLSGVERRGHLLILTGKRILPEQPVEPPPPRKQAKQRKGKSR